jgi:adenosylcobinamide kinase/adenosylcobinamide-phosphate guanylyltransferase
VPLRRTSKPRTPKARSRNRNAVRNPEVVAGDGVTLVLGGIRSGKSVHAEDLALALSGKRRPTYIATADPVLSKSDPGMAARIERHRGRRGRKWISVEATLDVPDAIRAAAKKSPVVLVDSLTVWLSNVMGSRRNLDKEIARLVAAIEQAPAPIVVVSDEVGLGGISANALARGFADALGALNETLAQVADRVVLVAAGLPITLKDTSARRVPATPSKGRP